MIHPPACFSLTILLSLLPGLLPTALGSDLEEPSRTPSHRSRPSVLFIAVDDLRPDLGFERGSLAITPHLDRLASQGRAFTRHYVQVPTCGASRYALLTGRRPDDLHSLTNQAFSRLREPAHRERATRLLPTHFRRQGYRTICLGKVGHQPDGRLFPKEEDGGSGESEMPGAWTRIVDASGRWDRGWGAFFGYGDGTSRTRGKTPPLERTSTEPDQLPDGLLATAAIEELESLAEKDQPFFLAVGFYRPHLPFSAPEGFWALYEKSELPPVPAPSVPTGVDPAISLHASGELLRNYGGHPEKPDPGSGYALEIRRAYLASVSHVDAQIGRVLEALERSGLDERTIVVVWSDHGWHLGEHGVWGKHTLTEFSLRSPLILRLPGQKLPGVACSRIVESVDVYPTLIELCHLPGVSGLDGESLVPQLLDPGAPSRDRAWSAWRRGRHVGYTLRTPTHRLTRWFREGEPVQVELYDHRRDPLEVLNLAGREVERVRLLSAEGPRPFHLR